MMKKLLLRLLLVPALVCAILGIGFLSTTVQAHAATLQTPATSVQMLTAQPDYTPGKNCPYGDAEADNQFTDAYVCFPTDPNRDVYDVYILNTGLYTVSWNWFDCNGNEHHSSKPPLTLVTYSSSPGGFAGYSFMCEIFDVVLS